MLSNITTSQFADVLEMSKPAFLSKVRRGEIVPINKEDWQIDGEYFFSVEEMERVKEKFKKPGLTIREVAEQLDVTPARVHQFIRREKEPLKAIREFYNGKNRYFVTEEDLLEFKERSHFQPNIKKHMVSRKHGFYLFQLFMNDKTNEYARIMEIDDEGQGIAVTEGDRKLSLDQLNLEGFAPVEHIQRKKFITVKGYVKFHFPLPNQIKSAVFKIMDVLYKEAGIENLRISVNGQEIVVEVKPIVLSQTPLEIDEVSILKNCVVDGDVSTRINGSLRLQSDLVSINTFVPSKLKKSIRSRAKCLNMTMEEFVICAIQKQLNTQLPEVRESEEIDGKGTS